MKLAEVESQLRQLALEMVRLRHGNNYQLHQIAVEVVAVDGGHRLQSFVGPARSERRPLRERVLEALARTERPLRGKELARVTGQKANSHFRSVLAELEAEGKVAFADGGYRVGTGILSGLSSA